MDLSMAAMGGAGVIAISALLALAVAAFGSWLGVKRGILLDAPCERSSHSVATSRAGGVAIMAGWFAAMMVAVLMTDGALRQSFAALAPAVAVAAILGVADDSWSLAPLVKLFGQIAAAALFVTLAGPLASAPLPLVGETALAPALGGILSVFWIVAFVNAFNFMDGANGLAGLAGLLGAAVLAVLCVGDASVAAPALFLTFAIGGFLRFNYPSGRIFMGDAGSHGVGLAFAALALLAARPSAGGLSPFFAPTLMAPFIVDVAFTLFHRARRGQPLLQAHREHIYQLLLRRGVSHGRVAGLYGFAIVLSAGAALCLPFIPAAWAWIAPLCMAALFVPPARSIFDGAVAAGLVTSAAGDGAQKGPTAADGGGAKSAALTDLAREKAVGLDTPPVTRAAE